MERNCLFVPFAPNGAPLRSHEVPHENQVYFRHRRRAFLPRQRTGRSLAGRSAQGPGPVRHHPEARPLHQRRPRHHEPVSARRGVRHRRRRGNRPRPGPLRTLSRRAHVAEEQHHIGPHLLQRDQQGTSGRLPGRHGSGDPPHHRRNQAYRTQSGRYGQPAGRGHHRNRRHGGRHRGPALSGGHAPVAVRNGPRQLSEHPPYPGALPALGGRTQNQAHPTQRQGIAVHRHSTRHHPLPLRGAHPGRGQAQDRPVLQRGRRRGVLFGGRQKRV